MKFESKYELNQTVWFIRRGSREVTKTCDRCGDNRPKFADGEEAFCGTCRNRGKVTEKYLARWEIGYAEDKRKGAPSMVRSGGEIGRIEITEFSKQYRAHYHESRITYMLNSTGVGCGTVWAEDDVWESEEAAQAECDRRNAILEQEEEK